MMPDQDQKQAKKEKIFRAALEAYTRFGIHDATTKQIAEIAGIGKSTIFEYFRNTDELMDEAFAWYIGQANSVWARLRKIAEAEPSAALSGYFDNLTEVILKDPGKLLLISQYATAILASSRDFAEVKQEYEKKLLPAANSLLGEFRFIVESGMCLGVFHPVGGANDEECALTLNAIVREMQAQAFVREESEIKETCLKLRRMAFRVLGCDTDFKQGEN